MARRYKLGKVFRKGRRKVRYLYPNGKKRGRRLVSVRSRGYRSARKYYRRRRY